jgi:hypothetical protein
MAVSYVFGLLFFRQDPKNPNKKSFNNLLEKLKQHEQYKREGKEYLKNELACTKEEECEFPFPYLKNYLEQRGLNHLTCFAKWSENTKLRSKVYINILKVRLRFYFPEKCNVLIRNEAHVRLASSSWYVSKLLQKCCIAGLFMIIASFLIYIIRYGNVQKFIPLVWNAFSACLIPFFPPLLLLLATIYAIHKIEDFLHYQRLREIIYVLETSYTAFCHENNRLILKDIFPEFGEISAEMCTSVGITGEK